MGLEVVDAPSGERVGWRQSAMRWGVENTLGLIVQTLLLGPARRWIHTTHAQVEVRARVEPASGDDGDDAAVEPGVNNLHPSRVERGSLPIVIPVLALAYSLTLGGRVRDGISRTRVVRIVRP
jgi:hypothetical protein